ncbi:MAG: ion channel, partial [Acidimicrobiales bacterium]
MEFVVLLLRLLGIGHRRHGAVLLAGAVLVVLSGGAIFAATEHLPVTTGWYWAVTTATTVGYGDVTPHNASGRFVASAVMLTAIPMLAASFALFTGASITEGLRRLVGMEDAERSSGFRLVVGEHPATLAIVEELRRTGEEVVLVADVDPTSVPEGVRVVRGDPTAKAVLDAARPELAVDCLLGGTSDGDVLVSAVLLRERAPDLRLIALVASPTVAEALHELGITEVVSADVLVAHTVAKTLEAPHAGSLFLGLLGSERERLVEE